MCRAPARRRSGRVRNEYAAHAALDNLGDTADTRGNGRQASAARLENRIAERLALRRVEKEVERAQEARGVLDEAKQEYSIGESARRYARLDRAARLPLADDDEHAFRIALRYLREPVDRVFNALGWVQLAHHPDPALASFCRQELCARRSARSRGSAGYPVANHDELVAGEGDGGDVA